MSQQNKQELFDSIYRAFSYGSADLAWGDVKEAKLLSARERLLGIGFFVRFPAQFPTSPALVSDERKELIDVAIDGNFGSAQTFSENHFVRAVYARLDEKYQTPDQESKLKPDQVPVQLPVELLNRLDAFGKITLADGKAIGGDLFGAWDVDSKVGETGQAYVQFVLGPGEDAERTRVDFYQDTKWQRTMAERMPKNARYLGDWFIRTDERNGPNDSAFVTSVMRLRRQRHYLAVFGKANTESKQVVFSAFLYAWHPDKSVFTEHQVGITNTYVSAETRQQVPLPYEEWTNVRDHSLERLQKDVPITIKQEPTTTAESKQESKTTAGQETKETKAGTSQAAAGTPSETELTNVAWYLGRGSTNLRWEEKKMHWHLLARDRMIGTEFYIRFSKEFPKGPAYVGSPDSSFPQTEVTAETKITSGFAPWNFVLAVYAILDKYMPPANVEANMPENLTTGVPNELMKRLYGFADVVARDGKHIGGDLFGTWARNAHGVAFVKFVLGPAKDAKRTDKVFEQNTFWRLDKAVILAQHDMVYLGEWFVRPQETTSLASHDRDRATYNMRIQRQRFYVMISGAVDVKTNDKMFQAFVFGWNPQLGPNQPWNAHSSRIEREQLDEKTGMQVAIPGPSDDVKKAVGDNSLELLQGQETKETKTAATQQITDWKKAKHTAYFEGWYTDETIARLGAFQKALQADQKVVKGVVQSSFALAEDASIAGIEYSFTTADDLAIKIAVLPGIGTSHANLRDPYSQQTEQWLLIPVDWSNVADSAVAAFNRTLYTWYMINEIRTGLQVQVTQKSDPVSGTTIEFVMNGTKVIITIPVVFWPVDIDVDGDRMSFTRDETVDITTIAIVWIRRIIQDQAYLKSTQGKAFLNSVLDAVTSMRSDITGKAISSDGRILQFTTDQKTYHVTFASRYPTVKLITIGLPGQEDPFPLVPDDGDLHDVNAVAAMIARDLPLPQERKEGKRGRQSSTRSFFDTESGREFLKRVETHLQQAFGAGNIGAVLDVPRFEVGHHGNVFWIVLDRRFPTGRVEVVLGDVVLSRFYGRDDDPYDVARKAIQAIHAFSESGQDPHTQAVLQKSNVVLQQFKQAMTQGTEKKRQALLLAQQHLAALNQQIQQQEQTTTTTTTSKPLPAKWPQGFSQDEAEDAQRLLKAMHATWMRNVRGKEKHVTQQTLDDYKQALDWTARFFKNKPELETSSVGWALYLVIRGMHKAHPQWFETVDQRFQDWMTVSTTDFFTAYVMARLEAKDDKAGDLEFESMFYKPVNRLLTPKQVAAIDAKTKGKYHDVFVEQIKKLGIVPAHKNKSAYATSATSFKQEDYLYLIRFAERYGPGLGLDWKDFAIEFQEGYFQWFDDPQKPGLLLSATRMMDLGAKLKPGFGEGYGY